MAKNKTKKIPAFTRLALDTNKYAPSLYKGRIGVTLDALNHNYFTSRSYRIRVVSFIGWSNVEKVAWKVPENEYKLPADHVFVRFPDTEDTDNTVYVLPLRYLYFPLHYERN